VPGAITLVVALIALLPLAAGCSSPSAPSAQAATATAATTAPVTVLPAVTASVAAAAAGTPLTTAVTPTAPITSTAVAAPSTPAGTPTPRPTPTGTAPDPFDLLNVFDIAPAGNIVVKRDILPLDGKQPDNVLVTLTGSRIEPSASLTTENGSAIGVMTYDPVYREWNLIWQSDPISGTARPLPASNQFGGTNGGDLLRDGSSVLMLRTTTVDRAAHLELFRYDRNSHKAAPLKMVPDAGAAEKDAIFDADLDVTVADLDDDGVYEVVADNLSGVKTWRWDGSTYVPRETR
jgi:hypothetical protein